jgi:hypothetical protein
MSTSVWTMVVGGVAGLALAAYGAWILVSGRAPAVTSRSFRCLRDAGFYHLLFGLALALVVVGTGFNRGLLTGASTLLAIGMAGVAIVRFRPRGGGHHPSGSR